MSLSRSQMLEQVCTQLLTDADPPDDFLLRQFLDDRSEAAFETLVRRHGPLVFGVCRRVLHDRHAAEDVFQATFLILARKADSIRRGNSLRSWLYGVACRLARKARKAALRREEKEQARPARSSDSSLKEIDARELCALLDEGVQALPTRYREAVLLCLVQEQTRDQAARELGLSLSTLHRRLERGKELLRGWLTRRGVTLPSVLLVAGLSNTALPAGLPAATARAARDFVSQALASGAAAELAREGLRGLFVNRLHAVMVLLTLTLACGAGLLAWQPAPQPSPPAAQQAERTKPKEAQPREQQPPGVLARLGSNHLRHEHEINGLDFSPDGKVLVSASRDQSLRFWDVATGREVRRIKPHNLEQDQVKFSADGKLVASDGGDGWLRVFDAQTGKEQQAFRPSAGILYPLGFSPDGKYVYTRAWDSINTAFEVLDIAAGKVARRVEPPNPIFRMAVSPDGRFLVVQGGKEASWSVWSVETGKQLGPIAGETQRWIAFTPDGKTLALAGVDKRVWLCDLATQKVKPSEMRGYPQIIEWLRDGKSLLIGALDDLVLWDVATAKEVRRIKLPRLTIQRHALSPDGKVLAVVEWGPRVRLFDLASGKEMHADGPAHRAGVGVVAVSPDGRLIASGANDGTLILWERATSKLLHLLKGHQAHLTGLAFTPDSKTLVAADNSGMIQLWDVARGTGAPLDGPAMQGKITIVFHGVKEMELSRDGRLLAAEDGVGSVKVWDLPARKVLWSLPRPNIPVEGLAFSPDGKVLVQGNKAYSASDGKLLGKFWDAEHTSRLANVFSPDGKVFASAGSSWPVRLYDSATRKEQRRLESFQNYDERIAFSPDGRTLAEHAGQVHLWELATSKPRARLDTPWGLYRKNLAFTPDGRCVVTGQPDTTVLVWDLTGFARDGKVTRPELTQRQLEEAWESLSQPDAERAYRAVWSLALSRGGVSFIMSRMPPVKPVSPEKVAALLKALDSRRFSERQEAMEELKRLGDFVLGDLERTLEQKPTLEVRKRIEVVLEHIRSRERLRTLRAVEALELSGSAEGRKALEDLAQGAPALRTREARAVLDRLAASR
jgi:RNA polymerase sigma factor (sigma-70 family)